MSPLIVASKSDSKVRLYIMYTLYKMETQHYPSLAICRNNSCYNQVLINYISMLTTKLSTLCTRTYNVVNISCTFFSMFINVLAPISILLKKSANKRHLQFQEDYLTDLIKSNKKVMEKPWTRQTRLIHEGPFLTRQTVNACSKSVFRKL